MFDLAARRQLNRGYSDGLSRALEIVVTPLLFGFLGRLVDSWLGTAPWFMLGFGAFAVSGMFVRFWLGYDREMKAHESRIPRAAEPAGPGDRAEHHDDAVTAGPAASSPKVET